MLDAATGLIYLGNGQYWDPETGRFLTRKALPGKTNPYVPWGGDPTGFLMGPLALLALWRWRKRAGMQEPEMQPPAMRLWRLWSTGRQITH